MDLPVEPLESADAESKESQRRREAVRAEIIASSVGRHYSPVFHLLVPSAFGLFVLVMALANLRELRLVELWTVPVTFIAAFGMEWRLHKDILHKRIWPLHGLYDRHERAHHVVYPAEDMAIRTWSEMALVLMPWYAIVLIVVTVAPMAWGVSKLLTPNCAILFLSTSVTTFLFYEWLHLSYHLPKGHLVWKLPVIPALSRLHTRHHDPKRMKRWNFNVTVPLFDWIHGTLDTGHATDPAKPRLATKNELPSS